MNEALADLELFDPRAIGSTREPESISIRGKPRIKTVDRRQLVFRAVDVEKLVTSDHPVRAIWEFVGKLDLVRFYESIKSVEEMAGRSAWDPQLLISLWIWAYSQGIGSAREIERFCEYDPAFQWLMGLAVVSHHTLSDFRVCHQEALDDLFVQVLGLLSLEGLISMKEVMHDGTKIKANAGADSFRREDRIRAHMERARQQVKAMGEPCEDNLSRQQAAQRRAAQEQQDRLQRALGELEKIRSSKSGVEAKQEARVSQTDPECRIMKQSDGGYAPSYNVQISTDSAHGIIVGVGVSQSSSDAGELIASVERVEKNMTQLPEKVVADGGFTNRANIMAMNEAGVDFIGSQSEYESQAEGQLMRQGIDKEFHLGAFEYNAQDDIYCCPAGKILRYDSQERRIGVVQRRYRARSEDCVNCAHKNKCCPKRAARGRFVTRAVEDPAVLAFKQKMETDEARAIYRRRGGIAEFPNAWIKSKIGLRQFSVRGFLKALMESLWACVTYNIQQWVRLRWRTQQAVSSG